MWRSRCGQDQKTVYKCWSDCRSGYAGRLEAETIKEVENYEAPGARNHRRLQAEAIKAEEVQRQPGPGAYRRAEAEELYKTRARGVCSRRCGRGCSRRMEERRSSGRRRGEEEIKAKERRGADK